VTRPPGPIEQYAWPEELDGHVVTPGPSPRLHGYDVEGDLAIHYRFADVALLVLIGEVPSDEQAAAFDVAMTFLAPLSIAEAPAHAAALSNLCGAPSTGVFGVAAVAAAERARALLGESPALLDLLGSPSETVDASLTASSDEEHQSVQRLREALARRGVRVPALDRPLSRRAALVATLFFAGLTRPAQLEAALVLASLPAVIAEAHHHTPGAFAGYPMQLPPFEYEDP